MDESKYLEHQNETMGENSFMKKLLKNRLNQKGLTLIELLAVIVILAIIAAIAIPAISNLIQNQRDKAVLADASSIISAAKLADAAGDCDMDATNATGCNSGNAQFRTYLGDIQFPTGTTAATAGAVKVERAGTPAVITLTYKGFDNLSSGYTATGLDLTADTITEANLNAALD